MSHVTNVKMQVKDLDALAQACEHLGLELRLDQKTYAWWGRFMNDSNDYGGHDPATFGHGEHAIRIKGDVPRNGSGGPWEIGVVRALDGDGFELLYDKFGAAGQRLTNVVGENVNALRREYSAAVATNKAKKVLGSKGWKLTRVEMPGNRIRLRVRR